MNASLVNWLPWSVLKISGLPFLSASSSASTQKPASMLAARIDYPTYVDDGSAQKAMARAAGAEYEPVAPWVFIVDAEGRVRYSRKGFRFSQSLSPTPTGLAGTRSP